MRNLEVIKMSHEKIMTSLEINFFAFHIQITKLSRHDISRILS